MFDGEKHAKIENLFQTVVRSVCGEKYVMPYVEIDFKKQGSKLTRTAVNVGKKGCIFISIDILTVPKTTAVAAILDAIITLEGQRYGVYFSSRQNTYNNRKYKTLADFLNVPCAYTGVGGGWHVDEKSQMVESLVKKCFPAPATPKEEPTTQATTGTVDKTKTPETQKQTIQIPEKPTSSTRKYVCPQCGMSVRATRTVNILCGDCFVRMVVETEYKKELANDMIQILKNYIYYKGE